MKLVHESMYLTASQLTGASDFARLAAARGIVKPTLDKRCDYAFVRDEFADPAETQVEGFAGQSPSQCLR